MASNSRTEGNNRNRAWLAALTAAALTAGSFLAATPAYAAPVYEITSRWAEGTPSPVSSGEVVNSEWRVNVNDDAAAPSNGPVDNVTLTVTATNGTMVEIPDACKTTGVTPVSSISADGLTLVCNVGTVHMGTAAAVQVPILADGNTGDTVTLSGEIGGVRSVPLLEIPIQNQFGMDMRWGSPDSTVAFGSGYADVPLQWTLSTRLGSDAGPNSVTYNLTYAAANGSATSAVGCTPFDGRRAPGHPFSSGTHDPAQMAPFVSSCTLTQTGPTTYQLTLTGINYTRTQVPRLDSAGNPLPVGEEAVASGQVTFRVFTTAGTGTTLTSNTPTYVAFTGQTDVDDPANNTSSKTITFPGGWSHWFNRPSGGSPWDNSLQVAAGGRFASVTGDAFSSTNPPPDTIIGMCSVIDTRFAVYEWADVAALYEGDPWNYPPGLGTYEWYVGTDPTLNPASGSYDPNAFTGCATAAGWVSTEPVDKATVKAVRWAATSGAIAGRNVYLGVNQIVKADAPAGQDIWTWGARRFGNTWEYPARNTDAGSPVAYTPVPGGRYPYTTFARDVLHVVTVQPAIQKTSDRDSVKPGEPAVFTLTYSANGVNAPETVDGYVLTDTLPAGMTYVPGTATPEPVITTNGSGQQVLTWTLNDVPTNTQVPLTYQAVAGSTVTPGSLLTNTVTASVNGQTATAVETITVSTNGYTQIGKSADSPFIPNLAGDGDGAGAWTVTLRSFDPVPQEWTDTIDILPYNGDQRGTSFSGDYSLTGVDAVSGATVYYTTADPATLSDDPADDANGAAGSVAGNTVGWSTTFTPDATAVRVIGPRLAPGAIQQFTVRIATDGAEGGDVFVNRAQARDSHTELVMRTSAPITVADFYSAALKKYVQATDGTWHDANDAADYPVFHVGDTIRYRIVVTNTGGGTLTGIEVSDDRQPQLGSFTIDSLAPDQSQTHEFEVTASAGMGDTVVNTACASADIPADSQVPPTINCDPAGLDIEGDPTHAKSLLSATPIGGGQWRVVYGIDVTNTSPASAAYTLDDTLHFTDQADIVSAVVTAAPDGVVLSTPAWDGAHHQRIALNVPIAGNDDAGYAPHHYEVTVIADVPLQLDGAGGIPDPTGCPAAGSVANQGFNNTSQLTDAGGVETDQACAPIPSIDITKSVSEGPTPNGDGTWTVVYDVVATNSGAFEGTYQVTDRMTAAGDLVVESRAVTATPAGVTASPTWTGLGAEGAAENVIASGVVLPAGGTHTYQVEVVLRVDATDGTPVIGSCDAASGANGGLANTAGIEHNDLTADASVCVTLAYITVDKTVAGGPTPNGDGTWTVLYDIVAENIGAAAGEYDLYDQLRFGEGIDIISIDTTGPTGVTLVPDWTGLGATPDAAENLLAENVALAASGAHTYQVEVVVELDEDTIDPAALTCPAPGSGAAGGLANGTLLDHNGIQPVDEVCPTLPLIGIDKSISAGPTGNGDGTWSIVYDLVATNTGAAAGDYDLVDELQFGDGIRIQSADVITVPAGVTDPAGWDGQGENTIATDVTLSAGAAHTYQVQAVISLDLDTVTPTALACPAPGEAGGLANTATVTHNGEDRADDVCAPLPLIDIDKSVAGAVTPVAGEDGVYDVTYQITVTNSGPGAGAYDLNDQLAPGAGVTVQGVQDATTDAADPVGINPAFLEGTSDRIVTGQPIAAAATGSSVVHTYSVTIRYALDLSQVDGPIADSCTVDGEPAPGTLGNTAGVNWNGITAEDDACVIPGKPTLDKQLISADPAGDGQWEVVYDLVVGNTGDEPTSYDLDDEFLFAPQVTVDTVTVTGPDGVAIDDTFDGDQNQRIATDVTIAGLDDTGYAPHVYRITVLADVPLQFDSAEPDGTGAPGCTVPAGSNTLEQGLNNAATLTDETGATLTDTDCAALPSWEIAKAMNGDPAQGANGTWTVNYTVTVTNDGAAAGEYTVTDRLRYGTGLTVTSATVTSAPDGVTPSASWTGRGAVGASQNVIATGIPLQAGGTHTYQVQVVARLDTAAADSTAITCPQNGSDQNGGFANSAGLEHNDLTDTAAACAVPEWPEDTPPPLAATGAALAWGIPVSALILLIIGGYAVWISRRRRTVAEPADPSSGS